MKKIAFVINELATGGVQQSLLNLLNEIKHDYEITLIVFNLRQKEMKRIPKEVKTIALKSPYRHLGISKADVMHKPVQFIIHGIWVYLTKIIGRSNVIKIMSLFQKSILGFDIAISFIHEANQHRLYGGCNEFVLKKIPCNKHITWIHCDFEHSGASSKQSVHIYSRFDTIVACSEGCKKSFINEIPFLENKCRVIKNCVNYDTIIKDAGNGFEYDTEYFNIVTVARLSEEKGLDRAIEAVSYCINRGLKILYHIIGTGDQDKYLHELTKKYDLSNYVHFYGNQENPYYYIKNADLFLLPSYHEAAPMVIDESAVLGVPVLSTKTTSTNEMLIQNNHGLVCENSITGIKQALYETIKNTEILGRIKSTLSQSEFNNFGTLNEIHKIFG